MTEARNPIDDAGALKRLLLNLYTGWGYNAYRRENQDRADDLLVRNGVCGLLAEARAALANHIGRIRRRIPTPSRDDPFPGAAERARIRDLEGIDRDIDALEALLRHLPVPENDSTWIRHRAEAAFLARLVEADQAMATHALRLREQMRAAADDADASALRAPIAALRQAIDARKSILRP